MPRATSTKDKAPRGRKDATTESKRMLSPKIRREAKPAEKRIRETDRTVPVAPAKQGKAAKAPIPVVAADQRREVIGTDEPKGQSGRGSKGNPLGLRTGKTG